MENLYVWLFISAGAAIALLGIFLFASEWDSGKQRRRFGKLRGKFSKARRSETRSPVELTTRNNELVAKIASLSNQLEESQRLVEKLQTEQSQLVDLGKQLRWSETQLSESTSENQEIADLNSRLQTEVADLKQQLQASEETIEHLHSEQQRLLDRLQTTESLVNRSPTPSKESGDKSSQLRSELAQTRQQVDQLMTQNTLLLEEINSLSTELTASQKTIEDLKDIKDRMSVTQPTNQHLHVANHELQQEFANIKEQLQTSETRLSESTEEIREIASRNSELQSDLIKLEQQLQQSHETIDELRTQHEYLAQVESENQQLQEELSILQRQLQRRENQLSESANENQEIADLNSRLQTEVADLKQRLEDIHAEARELEAVRQQLAYVESREMLFRDQQESLQVQIADLQEELSSSQQRVQELAATRERLAQTEHICQRLHADNRRLEEELVRSQERVAVGEQNQVQDPTLGQQLNEVQTEQPPLHAEFHKDLAAGRELIDGSSRCRSDFGSSCAFRSTTNSAQLIGESTESTVGVQLNGIPSGTALSEEDSPINGLGQNGGTHSHPGSDEPPTRIEAPNEIKPAARSSAMRNWRLGIIPATGVIAIAAAVALGLLGTSAVRFSRAQKRTVTSENVSSQKPTASEAALDPSTPDPAPVAALEGSEFSKQNSKPKPPLRLRGTFKIIRPTEVYNGPSENSALIGRIEPGMDIDVVDSRNNWLEIRSKHDGPGFVRQEAAVRIGHN
jgi:predicted RNase H-like nuclease (RuvC/YqgF family)